ncbi:MAG TPA: phage major capsid protein [Terriglobia bacterium]|nr:phage major capsid protein [Terriglobia bacterium]
MLSLTGVNAITNKDIIPKLWDVVFKYSPLLVRARTKYSYKFYGGTSIQAPITYKKLAGGAFQRGSAVDITWINTETAFQVVPKYYYVSVVLFGTDGVLNMGPEAAFSQIEAKMANASAAMGENLAEEMYYSGLDIAGVSANLGPCPTTGGDTTAISLDGMAQWIDDGNTVSTVGGITRTDLNAVNGTPGGGNAWVANIAGQIQTTDLNQAIGKTWFGPNRVDLITVSPDVYMFIQNKIQPQQRFEPKDTDLAKAGFQSIQYMGADLVVDNYTPAGSAWGINSRYFQFYISQNRLFQFGFTGFKEDQATVGDVAGQYAFGGDLVIPNPRTCFQLFGITS